MYNTTKKSTANRGRGGDFGGKGRKDKKRGKERKQQTNWGINFFIKFGFYTACTPVGRKLRRQLGLGLEKFRTEDKIIRTKMFRPWLLPAQLQHQR